MNKHMAALGRKSGFLGLSFIQYTHVWPGTIFLEERILGQEKSPLHVYTVYISASEVMFHFWAMHSMSFSRLRKNAVI